VLGEIEMLEPVGTGLERFDSAAVEVGPPDLVLFRPKGLVRGSIDLQAARIREPGDEHGTAAAVQVAKLDLFPIDPVEPGPLADVGLAVIQVEPVNRLAADCGAADLR
jgi:hypothetical protein